MLAQKESPVECTNTHGAKADHPCKEISMINSTAIKASAAYRGGWESYPFARETGQHAARLWLAGKPAFSLAHFRDNRWKAFMADRSKIYPGEHEAFNAGFERALAEHIAGDHRHE